MVEDSTRITRRKFLSYVATGTASVVAATLAAPLIGYFLSPADGEAGAVADTASLRGKPNILWIVMDTVRADHLSCYGYYRNTTPNIDRIASEGILYENTFSTAPWTLPSHASMFTGMFPSKHGADAEHQCLDHNFQTIAEVLSLYGYKTFGYSNNSFAVSYKEYMNQGFDTFEVTKMGKKMKSANLADELKINNARREVQNSLLMDDGARRTNEVVKEWISEAHREGTPFFVFINYMEAHLPYHPPESFARPYLGGDVSLAEAMGVSQDQYGYITGKKQMSDEDFEILRALYDGEISYLDFRMGQLFDYLRELDILDNTILIVTADHGENFGEHNMMDHILCVYDTLLHVPLIIRYPSLFEAGLRVSEQVQLTDIYPTLLDIVGIEWDSKEIQGRSLLRERGGGEPRFAIAEHAVWVLCLEKLKKAYFQFDVSKYTRRLKTIRTEKFKYIWSSDGHDELYNIQQDPGELYNLIEINPEKAEELKALLKEWLDSFEPYRLENAQQIL